MTKRDKARRMTRRELATALKVHMMTVTKWEREGLPIAERGSRGRPSRYDLAAVKAWLAAREKQTGGSGSEFRRAQAATAGLREEQTRLAQLEYQRRAGTLIDAAVIEGELRETFTRCRTRLLAVPSKAKFTLPHLTHSDVLALDRLVREALEELATLPPSVAKGEKGAAA